MTEAEKHLEELENRTTKWHKYRKNYFINVIAQFDKDNFVVLRDDLFTYVEKLQQEEIRLSSDNSDEEANLIRILTLRQVINDIKNIWLPYFDEIGKRNNYITKIKNDKNLTFIERHKAETYKVNTIWNNVLVDEFFVRTEGTTRQYKEVYKEILQEIAVFDETKFDTQIKNYENAIKRKNKRK